VQDQHHTEQPNDPPPPPRVDAATVARLRVLCNYMLDLNVVVDDYRRELARDPDNPDRAAVLEDAERNLDCVVRSLQRFLADLGSQP
jgi:hypothetical protein